MCHAVVAGMAARGGEGHAIEGTRAAAEPEIVGRRGSQHVLKCPGPELADTVISERAGIRGHDHFGTAQHECPGCCGKLTVEADHHADPDRPTSGVQAGHRERLARGEPSFEHPVAGMDFCIGEDITAVPVDDRRRVARRAWPPLQVGDRNSDLGPAGGLPEGLQPGVSGVQSAVGPGVAPSRVGRAVGVADLPPLRNSTKSAPRPAARRHAARPCRRFADVSVPWPSN